MPGAPSLCTGLSTYQPVCFYRGTNGDLFWVNGLRRPYRWDGITSAAEDAGITAPVSSPSVSGSGSGSLTGDYVCAVQYIDDTLPDPVSSSIGDLVSVTVSAKGSFSWSSIPVSPEARVVSKILWRSTAGETETLYKITTIANATTTYSGDTSSDATISATTNDSLPILLPNGDLNARRFGVPPSDRPFACMYRDRVWMAGRVKYSEGTVATAGTTTITGTSTNFVAAMVGMYLYIDGEAAPLVISAVGSSTGITTSTAAANTASGKSFVITAPPDERNQLAFSEQDEPESMPDTNVVTIQDNTGDEDEVTGLMPYGSFLYVLKDRHVYSLAYVSQPKIDVGINLVAWRGCLNHRCWDILDGVCYLMDATGIYAFTGSEPQPIDSPIQNMFWDGTIDFTVSKWFWVKADARKKLVYFAVSFAGDNSTRPTRCLVYNPILQSWSEDQYIWEVGGGCIASISGAARLLVGSEHELVFASDDRTSDFATSLTDQVSAATSNTLTGTAGFILAHYGTTDVLKDCPIAIVSGTGAGQLRRITANDSDSVTISQDWTTTPDTTSVCMYGAISWSHKSGQWAFQLSEKNLQRRFYLSAFPTTTTNYVNLRTFKNKYQTVDVQEVDEDRGNGVTTTAGLEPHVFNISRDRVPQDKFSSVQTTSLPGYTDDLSNAQRWIALQLDGFQGPDQISIDMYALRGVAQ